MMKILFIILGLWLASLFVMSIHNLFLKWLPYRWLINSIIYPCHKAKLKRKLSFVNFNGACMISNQWNTSKHWFDGFWFHRRLTKMINDKVIQLSKANGAS